MLLGLDNAKSVLQTCARHRVAYVWGFLVVVIVVLLISWALTANEPPDKFHVPLWLLILPFAFGFLYSLKSQTDADTDLSTEHVEYVLSGMSKRDYLNYKVGDDRAAKSFAATATSAGLLSGTSLLGPFLRADR